MTSKLAYRTARTYNAGYPRRDNGPRFTALLVAVVASVGAGWWLAVVLAGAFGIH